MPRHNAKYYEVLFGKCLKFLLTYLNIPNESWKSHEQFGYEPIQNVLLQRSNS